MKENKFRRKTTHVRAYPRDREHMNTIKQITGMGQAAQIEELLQLKKYVLENSLVKPGSVKGVLKPYNEERTRNKTAFGHKHDYDKRGVCRGCGLTKAATDWEADDNTR